MCVATKRLELLISPRVQTVKVTLLFNQPCQSLSLFDSNELDFEKEARLSPPFLSDKLS